MTKRVEDTSKNPKPSWLFGAQPKHIEAQEAEGQRQLVESTQLPTQIGFARPGEENHTGRKKFEELGFKLGQPGKDDPLFLDAELPEGWKKESSDHSMWSYVVDEQGRERVSIFYKAAFYDRGAHMQLLPRFTIRDKYAEDRTLIAVEAMDANAVLFSAPVTHGHAHGTDGYYKGLTALEEEATVKCSIWLDKNRAGWGDLVKAWLI